MCCEVNTANFQNYPETGVSCQTPRDKLRRLLHLSALIISLNYEYKLQAYLLVLLWCQDLATRSVAVVFWFLGSDCYLRTLTYYYYYYYAVDDAR